MKILRDPFPGPCRPDTLVVLLPPAQSQLMDFHTQDFVGAVRRKALPVDIALAEVTYEHVMRKTVASLLDEQVVQPAKVAGYRDIWLAGISLGAFAALHYAAEHAENLAGIHLIAPYPGTGDILAEIMAAGGPAPWAQTPLSEGADERAWWRWLCREADAGKWRTPVHLSTGTRDRFGRGQSMLAALLPSQNVRTLAGGHDWQTWQGLWQDWLEQGPFATRWAHTVLRA
jgi:pimeloyl-ACP methyl ester carboxylesterase